jgi:NTE family protein
MAEKLVTLALQGGGSHGAFTWGVLDRLLEDGRVAIEGISGASAGAMNATVLAHGYALGGRDGARQALRDFWESVASKAPFSFLSEEASAAGDITRQSELPAALKHTISLARFFSPHQMNPFDINPLRDILSAQVDFERLRSSSEIKLFIATTKVSSGTLRLFRNRQLTLDVLLASACLPTVHRAVEIDGEAYWDGGLTANPPLFPLIQKCRARDMMVVLLHPLPRRETPKSAEEIFNRLSEMGFSSTFHTEMEAIMSAKREAGRSWLSFGLLERRLRQLNMHVIEAQELMSLLSMHSKMNAQAPFLRRLHDEGRLLAQAWLEKHFQHVGVRSSFRLSKFFP